MLCYGGWTSLGGPECEERAPGCMGPQEKEACVPRSISSPALGVAESRR